MDPGLLAILSGLGGAVITALGTAVVNIIRAKGDEGRKNSDAVIAQYAVLCDRYDRQTQEQRLEIDKLYEVVIALNVEHRQCHDNLNELRVRAGLEPLPVKEHSWMAANLASAEFRQRTNQQREENLRSEHDSAKSLGIGARRVAASASGVRPKQGDPGGPQNPDRG